MKVKTDAEVALDTLLDITKRVTYFKEPDGQISLMKLTFRDGTVLTMDELVKHYKPINQ